MTTEEQIKKIMDDNELSFSYQFDFPKYRELPDEVLLALKILKTHGLKILITLVKK